MPIFDFICTDCGHQFEKLVRGAEAKQECPKCGASANKQVSAPARPQFKGGGFYETDFKNQ